VITRPSPWRLGPAQNALAAEWLRGWAGAAAEQRPYLPVPAYLERRLADVEAGAVTITVGHEDLLAQFD
jgi:hypothetical protein